MNKINKAIILPIVAGLMLVVSYMTDQPLTDMDAETLTNAILAIVALVGVFISPIKKD